MTPDEALKLVQDLKDTCERTELALDQGGYRWSATHVCGARLRLSEAVTVLKDAIGVWTSEGPASESEGEAEP